MKQSIKFCNTYVNLPQSFYELVNPVPVGNPSLIRFNTSLASELGIEALMEMSRDQIADYFSGNKIFEGSIPLALAYAGHQFGHFVPVLGDGRANLLGELTDKAGRRFDLQLKGSGLTSFSRRGDGRAALGPMLREYMLSEAMNSMSIPSSRALCVVQSGEEVVREKVLPGGILTRVAASHLRIGSFEYFMARQDADGLKILADYAIKRHYQQLAEHDQKYLELFKHILQRQAALVAKWMSVGFIHGVMNTDNISISGETIDYGPCAFMDFYNPQTVYSYIDKDGRYSYGNQPAIMNWNLARFAEALLPLIDCQQKIAIEKVMPVLQTFPDFYRQSWLIEFSSKLGIFDAVEDDFELINSFLSLLSRNKADFTISFRALSSELKLLAEESYFHRTFRAYFEQSDELTEWLKRWKLRVCQQNKNVQDIINLMNSTNPVLIPRNHIIEDIINQAYYSNSFNSFNRFCDSLTNIYSINGIDSAYLKPPTAEQQITYTYCGT